MDDYNKGDNKPKGPGTNRPKMPFNLYWIYLLVFGAIIGMYFFTDNSVTKEVPWSDFQGYVRGNSISKIVVDNKNNTLKAYVRTDSVKNVYKTDAERAGSNPSILVKIPSADKFSDFYDKVRAEHNINTTLM